MPSPHVVVYGVVAAFLLLVAVPVVGIAALVAQHLRLGLDPGDERTYGEMRLAPDTAVTVLGAVSRDPERRHPVVRAGDRRPSIFEGDAASVRSTLRRRVRSGTVVGLAGLLAGPLPVPG